MELEILLLLKAIRKSADCSNDVRRAGLKHGV